MEYCQNATITCVFRLYFLEFSLPHKPCWKWVKMLQAAVPKVWVANAFKKGKFENCYFTIKDHIKNISCCNNIIGISSFYLIKKDHVTAYWYRLETFTLHKIGSTHLFLLLLLALSSIKWFFKHCNPLSIKYNLRCSWKIIVLNFCKLGRKESSNLDTR